MTKFYKDIVQLHNSLIEFNDGKPILVLYNDYMKCLMFRKPGKTSILYFLSGYFIHENFKYGVLLAEDYVELMDQLLVMTSDMKILEDKYVISAGINRVEVLEFNRLSIPPNKPKYDLKLISFTSRNFIIMSLFKFKSKYFRELCKTIINEKPEDDRK